MDFEGSSDMMLGNRFRKPASGYEVYCIHIQGVPMLVMYSVILLPIFPQPKPIPYRVPPVHPNAKHHPNHHPIIIS